jgi:hypothetical protein
MPEWQDFVDALNLQDEGFAPPLAEQCSMMEDHPPKQVDEDEEGTYWDVYVVFRRVGIPKEVT